MKLYRFRDMVGNQTTISLIRKALENDKFPNASYMKGQSGTGKTTSAEVVGMYLTCLHPVDGDPCLECSECKRNIEALNTSGKSRNLIKVNMGKYKNAKEINELVDEVFTLSESNNNRVYILEELHALDQNLQITFLEYIDRLSKNIYIIVCSTDSDKIITPLKDRLSSYVFRRLQEKDSIYLLDREAQQRGVALPKDVKQLLIRYAKGIPRKLIKMVELIVDSNPTLDELARHIEYIPYSVYIELYSSLMTSSREGSLALKEVLTEYDPYTFSNGFRDFLVDLMFLLYGNITEPFTKSELTKCKEMFDKRAVMILNRSFNSETKRMSENTLSYLLFESALRIKQESMSSVLKSNTKDANIQYNEALSKSNTMEKIGANIPTEQESPAVKKLSADSFKNVGTSSHFGGVK